MRRLGLVLMASAVPRALRIGQARSLRWISNDAVTRNITDKLQAARTAISKRQFDVAFLR